MIARVKAWLSQRLLALVTAILCSTALVACGGGSGGGQAGTQPDDPSLPPVKRHVYFGYFFSGPQLEEVLDHADIGFELAVFNDSTLVPHLDLLRASGGKAMLEIEKYTYANNRYVGDAALKGKLHWLLDIVAAAGHLDTVVAFYPVDEPDLKGVPETDVVAANRLIHEVCQDYPTLGGCNIAVIYSDHYPVGHATYDWLGTDGGNYGQGILPMDLLPGQKLILIPGGADPWREEPQKFVDYALRHPEVALVMPFLWVNHYGGEPYLGISDNGMAAKYRAAGKTLTLKNP